MNVRSLLFASLIALPAPAMSCDVALMLAVDVSGSVDTAEYHTQMQGLAEALRDGAVSEALVRAEAEVSVIQWTGKSRQAVTIPWVRVSDFDDTDNLADQIAGQARLWRNFSTAIGEALVLAQISFQEVSHCTRKIIDVSGDGFSNEGILPRDVWPALEASGITVNALAIEASEESLSQYFWSDVIFGPGAFVVAADNYAEYPARIRQKLLREITKQIATLD